MAAQLTGIFLYLMARLAVGFVCLLPLRWAARLGRACGNLAYYADSRHRRVAQRNLTLCFSGSKSAPEIVEIARENFRRIGENICCALKSTSMNDSAAKELFEVHQSSSPQAKTGFEARNVVLASGHFGNFELFTRIAPHFRQFRQAATYRGIRQQGLDSFLRRLRGQYGVALFERRSGSELLKKELSQGGVMLILISDQSDRKNGLKLSFLGHPAFTNRAPAVMALRYDCALFVPICYRIALGQYRIEMGEPIPTREADGTRRTCEAVTRDINSAFEAAILRDPANWFWVHNRWKEKAPVETDGV